MAPFSFAGRQRLPRTSFDPAPSSLSAGPSAHVADEATE